MSDSTIWHNLGIVLTVMALLCWVVVFFAGTDVWHDTGSHDFWNLKGPPYHDLRVLACAYYTMFFVLIAGLVVQIRAGMVGARRMNESPDPSSQPTLPRT